MALTAVEEAQLRDLIAQQSALLSLAGVEATILSKLGATKVTLSGLPSATVIDDADLLLLRQGVTDKSVTGLTFKNLIPVVSDASTTVKGIVELATDAEAQAGIDDTTAVTPASARSNTVTPASDPTYADDSTKWVSTSWLRNGMGAIATAAGFAYSFTANGYFKFPSWLAGLIIQWGKTGTITSDNGVSVTFPIAFPTAVFGVFPTITDSSSDLSPDSPVHARSITTTTVRISNSWGAGSVIASWFSIGH